MLKLVDFDVYLKTEIVSKHIIGKVITRATECFMKLDNLNTNYELTKVATIMWGKVPGFCFC